MAERVAARLALGIAALVLFAPAAAAAEDAPNALRTGGLLRVHWDYPAKASLGFGVILARMPANFDCKTTCLYRGSTIQGAAGLGAGELAVGYGSMVAETGRGDWLLRHVYMGYGVRASLLRTWGSSTLDPAGATFLGVQGAFTVTQFSVTMGVYRRVTSVEGENGWRVFGGIGWGF